MASKRQRVRVQDCSNSENPHLSAFVSTGPTPPSQSHSLSPAVPGWSMGDTPFDSPKTSKVLKPTCWQWYRVPWQRKFLESVPAGSFEGPRYFNLQGWLPCGVHALTSSPTAGRVENSLGGWTWVTFTRSDPLLSPFSLVTVMPGKLYLSRGKKTDLEPKLSPPGCRILAWEMGIKRFPKMQ